MHIVEVNRKIDFPKETIWDTLKNFGGIYKYHPLVNNSFVLNGRDSGLGAERMCEFNDGNKIKERIIDYTEGEEYIVDIFEKGSFPLKKAVATINVVELDEGNSEVKFKMEFKPKFGILGWLMAKGMMEKQFKKILSQVLFGLEKHIKTGNIVGIREINTN